MIGLELKRFVNLKSFVILIIFLAIALIMNDSGINKMRKLEDTKKEFIECENQKVESFKAYTQYSMTGLKILFFPSPISAVSHNTTLSYMHSLIDTNYKLEIDYPQKGKNLFKGNTDLFWYLSTIGSIASLLLGWLVFRNRDYVRFLLNAGSKLTVYASIFFARIILLFFSMYLLMVCLLAQFYINGLSFGTGLISYLFVYMTITAAVMSFFLFAGSLLGTIKNAANSLMITFLFWISLVVIWPDFLDSSFSERAENDLESIYIIETDKVKLIYEYEKLLADSLKDKEDKITAIKEFTEKFLEEGEIDKVDIQFLEKTEEIVNDFYLWSSINPTTFYRSVNYEISSRGYNEYIRFYKEIVNKKKEFAKYCLKKMFQPGKVKPYLSRDEYIFYAKPSLPVNFGLGLIILFSWIILLFTVGYFLFNKIFFPGNKPNSLRDVTLNFERGKHHFYAVDQKELLVTDLFALFKNKKSGGFTVDGKEIDSSLDFFYLPSLETIPADIGLSSLSKSLGVSEPVKNRYELMQEFFKKLSCDVLLLDNFFYGIDKTYSEKLIELIVKLKEKGLIVIEITQAVVIFTGQNGHGRYDEYKDFVLKEQTFQNKYTSRKSK